ncbi:MAG: hypothetical protein V1863_06210 [Candidatus Omnitrophota bacterium]
MPKSLASAPHHNVLLYDATTLVFAMRTKKGILLFGLVEIAIGTITLTAVLQSHIAHTSLKPLNVFAFVLVSSLISLALGSGILLRLPYARKWLMFFAGWVILSKVLIFARIITLNGALETTVSPDLKNIISIIYHALVMLYFHRPSVKARFEE